jgi:hypothetical protein
VLTLRQSMMRYDLNRVVLTEEDQRLIINLLVSHELGNQDITDLLSKYYDTDETEGNRLT